MQNEKAAMSAGNFGAKIAGLSSSALIAAPLVGAGVGGVGGALMSNKKNRMRGALLGALTGGLAGGGGALGFHALSEPISADEQFTALTLHMANAAHKGLGSFAKQLAPEAAAKYEQDLRNANDAFYGMLAARGAVGAAGGGLMGLGAGGVISALTPAEEEDKKKEKTAMSLIQFGAKIAQSTCMPCDMPNGPTNKKHMTGSSPAVLDASQQSEEIGKPPVTETEHSEAKAKQPEEGVKSAVDFGAMMGALRPQRNLQSVQIMEAPETPQPQRAVNKNGPLPPQMPRSVPRGVPVNTAPARARSGQVQGPNFYNNVEALMQANPFSSLNNINTPYQSQYPESAPKVKGASALAFGAKVATVGMNGNVVQRGERNVTPTELPPTAASGFGPVPTDPAAELAAKSRRWPGMAADVKKQQQTLETANKTKRWPSTGGVFETIGNMTDSVASGARTLGNQLQQLPTTVGTAIGSRHRPGTSGYVDPAAAPPATPAERQWSWLPSFDALGNGLGSMMGNSGSSKPGWQASNSPEAIAAVQSLAPAGGEGSGNAGGGWMQYLTNPYVVGGGLGALGLGGLLYHMNSQPRKKKDEDED